MIENTDAKSIVPIEQLSANAEAFPIVPLEKIVTSISPLEYSLTNLANSTAPM